MDTEIPSQGQLEEIHLLNPLIGMLLQLIHLRQLSG